MKIGGSIVVLLIAWWIAFQALLPIGVKSPAETGDKMVGDPGAPVRADLLKKGLWSVVIAIAVWAVMFSLVQYSGLSFADFPSP